MMEQLISFKAFTSSIRHKRIVSHPFFIKKYHFFLLKGLSFKGGRNHLGRISIRYRKKSSKRFYRYVDFKRNFLNIPYFALQIEKDPNRNALISLIKYQNGTNSYIIVPKNFELFKKLYNLSVHFNLNKSRVNLGECYFLKKIPIGSLIYNIEFFPNQGGKLARTSGSFGQLIEKDFSNNLGLILLKSGKKLLLSLNCKASLGIVSNFLFDKQILGKAGSNRWKGFKSNVRGVAMNPIDHPHGGGEGKSSGGRCSVSKWGKLTKGFKTRSRRKKSKYEV